MDEPTKEQKFSCGCHVVDGVLVAECTQIAPTGEISAARHGVLKPYAAKCGRKAAQQQAEAAAAKAKADADLKVAKAEEAAAQAEEDAYAGTSPEVPFPGPVVGEGSISKA
jgi:hypothetical protein